MWIQWAAGAEQEEFERLLADDAFKKVKTTMGTTWFEHRLEQGLLAVPYYWFNRWRNWACNDRQSSDNGV